MQHLTAQWALILIGGYGQYSDIRVGFLKAFSIGLTLLPLTSMGFLPQNSLGAELGQC